MGSPPITMTPKEADCATKAGKWWLIAASYRKRRIWEKAELAQDIADSWARWFAAMRARPEVYSPRQGAQVRHAQV